MMSREEIERRFDSLERELTELRRVAVGQEVQDSRTDMVRALRFLKAFYNAPGHRLQAADARLAATDAGLSARALAGFYAGTRGALRAEGNWCVLTGSGKQWYEENLAYLMSESE